MAIDSQNKRRAALMRSILPTADSDVSRFDRGVVAFGYNFAGSTQIATSAGSLDWSRGGRLHYSRGGRVHYSRAGRIHYRAET